jgi:hypothetical protein
MIISKRQKVVNKICFYSLGPPYNFLYHISDTVFMFSLVHQIFNKVSSGPSAVLGGQAPHLLSMGGVGASLFYWHTGGGDLHILPLIRSTRSPGQISSLKFYSC